MTQMHEGFENPHANKHSFINALFEYRQSSIDEIVLLNQSISFIPLIQFNNYHNLADILRCPANVGKAPFPISSIPIMDI
jgi:hypothetical protein